MTDGKLKDELTAELRQIEEASSHFLFKRMFLWVIRWTIGFTIIGVLVHFYSGLSWLWWVGIAFASLTPVTSLIARFYMNRKINETREKIEELQNTLSKENI